MKKPGTRPGSKIGADHRMLSHRRPVGNDSLYNDQCLPVLRDPQ